MLQLIVLLVLLGLASLSYHMSKSILHPVIVFCSAWALQVLGLIVWSDSFFESSTLAYALVGLGATAFFVGGNVVAPATTMRRALAGTREIRKGSGIFLLAAAVVAVCMAGQYQAFTSVAPGEAFEKQLVLVRLRFVVENEDVFGIFKYGNTIAIGALLLLEVKLLRGRGTFLDRSLFLFFAASAGVLGVLSTGRGPIAFALILAAAIYALMRGVRIRSIFAATLVLIAVFVLFWIMGRAMGKAGDDAASAASDLVGYAFSPLPALSVFLQQTDVSTLGGDGGSNTLRFFVALAASLGWVDRPGNLVQPFVSVPTTTNLYTSYMHYVLDFGLIGALGIMLLLGVLHGKIFSWAQKNPQNDLAVFCLGISYLPLLQAVFQETHFTGLSVWIQYGLLGFVFTRSTSVQRVLWPHPSKSR